MLIALAPFMCSDLRKPYATTVVASDASSTGGGTVKTTVSTEQALALAAQASKGWYTKLETDEVPAHLHPSDLVLDFVKTAQWEHARSVKWNEARREQHINILEMTQMVSSFFTVAEHHLGERFIIIGDSAAAIGALAKGRSSSNMLNAVCRRAASVLCALDMVALYLWVPTAVSPADRASRQ
jgi:hypothetical protein